ncbi:MAG: TetR/AcrR family transcriptional regulator [Clostridiales bacterium]|nr:TetR/AcrR family transcriptional regulator [Clostridiales bacterium]
MREKICNAALELFVEKGYESVSLREIALRADTTIGNLTYYFPKKENLLAALQKQVQDQFPLDKNFSQDPIELMNQLIDMFFDSQKNEQNHPYYYNNICEFYKDSDPVRANIQSFRKKLFSQYYILLITLKDMDVLDANYDTQSFLNLTYMFVFMSSFWVANASPRFDDGLPDIPITTACYHLLLPYVNKEYRESFQRIFEEHKKQIT